MASGDRSKRIRVNVQRVLQNRGETLEGALALSIFEAGDRIQRRIAEEALCIEGTVEIDTESGEELYQLPPDFISERIIIPSGATTELRKIDMEEVYHLKRLGASTTASDSTADDLFHYYLWNEQIGFLLNNGGAPSSVITITMYYWRYPGTGENLSETKDPIVRPQFDDVIYKGIVAELTGDSKWEARFESTLHMAKSNERSRQEGVYQVANNRSYD